MSGVLPSWIERFLGFDAQEFGEGIGWRLDVAWDWPPWVTLLFVAFAFTWVSTIYRKEFLFDSKRPMTVCILLRLGILALLMVMLAEPTIVLRRTGLPSVVVLIDDSASMGIVDSYSEESSRRLTKRLKPIGLETLSRLNLAKLILTEDNAALIDAIGDRYQLRVFLISDSVRPIAADDPLVETIRGLEASGTGSRLGTAVGAVLGDLRGAPPAALVILSDGITTDGETLKEAALHARRMGVPLFTVGLGREEGIRDVELSDLLVNEVVFLNDVVNFQCTLTATGFAGRQVEIVLSESGKKEVLSKTTMKLSHDGEPLPIRLPYRPQKEGQFEYEIQVTQLPGEAQTDNNRLSRSVSVRNERIRVLIVQAYPSYEFRYLKHLLEREKTIELKTVLQEADLDYAQLDDTALRLFPIRREELFTYDVIIFGDVNPALLSTKVMSHINDFVEQKGGGMVFIAGERYLPLAYRDTPLARLFPVDLSSVTIPHSTEAFVTGSVVLPTAMGLASPPLQLGDSTQETAELWKNFAPIYWYLEATQVKPAARVLAEHPTETGPDGRKLPLICLQYVGAGKVLFHATDETWRWRWRMGDTYFARYWIQAMRYLARSKLIGRERGAELSTDRGEYRHGEMVRLRARFVDDRLAPAHDDGVTVVVEREGHRRRQAKLRRVATNRGIFEGVLTGIAEGNYHVWMATPSFPDGAPSTDFLVTAPLGEFQRVKLNMEELSQAAQITHGHAYTIDTASRVVADLPRGRPVPIETLPPAVLWNQWWVLSIILSMLILEWLIRRRYGLL